MVEQNNDLSDYQDAKDFLLFHYLKDTRDHSNKWKELKQEEKMERMKINKDFYYNLDIALYMAALNFLDSDTDFNNENKICVLYNKYSQDEITKELKSSKEKIIKYHANILSINFNGHKNTHSIVIKDVGNAIKKINTQNVNYQTEKQRGSSRFLLKFLCYRKLDDASLIVEICKNSDIESYTLQSLKSSLGKKSLQDKFYSHTSACFFLLSVLFLLSSIIVGFSIELQNAGEQSVFAVCALLCIALPIVISACCAWKAVTKVQPIMSILREEIRNIEDIQNFINPNHTQNADDKPDNINESPTSYFTNILSILLQNIETLSKVLEIGA